MSPDSEIPPGNVADATPHVVPDKTLTSKLTADHDALQNDLEQAQELARVYQCQLASKSNEFAALKFVLEKSLQDLGHMQDAIVELRKERHQLANEAMKSARMEQSLLDAARERERLERELSQTKDGLICAERIARTKVAERERLQRDLETISQALACSEKAVLDLETERNNLSKELDATRRALATAEATVRELWRKNLKVDGATADGGAGNESDGLSSKSRNFIEVSFDDSREPDVAIFPAPKG